MFVLAPSGGSVADGWGAPPFTFVTGGIDEALRRAAAGGGDVAIAGGAATVRQYLAAGLLDELLLHIVPVLLGAGERLLEGVGSPAVTHLRYRIGGA